MTRIRMKIDRITSDVGLDRAILETALRREVGRMMTSDGFVGAESGYRPQVRAELPKGRDGMADRIAGVTVRAVKPQGRRGAE